MALIDNLIAYYKLDETSGTRVDSHSNGLDLTDNNTVGSGTGIINNGADLASGSSEYLSHADDALFDVSSTASWSFWVKSSSYGSNMAFAGKMTFNTDNSWLLEHQADGLHVRIATSASDISTEGVGGAATSGSWTHYLVVFDGAGATNADRLKVWKNGSSVTLTFSGTIPATIRNSASEFVIGVWSGLGRYYNGLIDEFGFWSDAKTGTDATSLYNSGAGLAYPFSSSSIKTWNGVANASVKTWDGVARASVKTWNGIA